MMMDTAVSSSSLQVQQGKEQEQHHHQSTNTSGRIDSSRSAQSACNDDDEYDAQAAHSIAIDNNNNNKTKSGDNDDRLHVSSSCRSSDDDKDDKDNGDPLKSLHPPPTCMEKMRDALLRFLDHAFFQYLGIAVLLGVVVSGAVFFFFLMGWQTLCSIPSKTDCQPRNDIYNVAIQVLTAFFTYMATFSMPWRCVNFLHTVGWHCPACRGNAPGHDLYGLPTDDVWFHIPTRPRLVILVFLLWNCLFQYANQVSRILFYNYELQDEFPGTLWTNLFFVSSMACAAAGGALLAYYMATIRITDPQRFGLGPVDWCKELWNVHVRGKEPRQQRRETQDANDEESFDSHSSSCHCGVGQDDNIAIEDVETMQQQRQESNHYMESDERPTLVVQDNNNSGGVDVVPLEVGGRPDRCHVSSAAPAAVLISTAAPVATTTTTTANGAHGVETSNTNTTEEPPHHRHHRHHHHGQHHDQHPHHHYHDPTRSEDPPLTGEQNRGAMRMWAM